MITRQRGSSEYFAIASGNCFRRSSSGVAAAGQHPVDPRRLEQIFGSTLSRATREVVDAAPPGLRAPLILGSPDFMRR